tara:strand:+ start:610 stop:915 length:306 start_codon:yes stop_codon:yes gene_type:complete
MIKKTLDTCKKKNKLPGKLIKGYYEFEYGKYSLYMQNTSIKSFQKFVIVDDLLTTGITANCVINMLKSLEKIILALSVIIELTELKGLENINIPVFSEIKY